MNIKKYFILGSSVGIVLFSMVFQPLPAHATDFMQILSQPFFIGCSDNLGSNNSNGGGQPSQSNICGWDDFKTYLNKAINYLLGIGVLLATVALAYAGVKLLVSDGAGQLEEARKMLWAIVKGFFFMLCAWLIVKFILDGFGVTAPFTWLGQ